MALYSSIKALVWAGGTSHPPRPTNGPSSNKATTMTASARIGAGRVGRLHFHAPHDNRSVAGDGEVVYVYGTGRLVGAADACIGARSRGSASGTAGGRPVAKRQLVWLEAALDSCRAPLTGWALHAPL